MQEQIQITFKDGSELIVPKTAEGSHRKIHPEKIASIKPVGEASKQAATNEAAIAKMIAQKQKEISQRLVNESPQEITKESTKNEIIEAMEAKGIKFNPNHRKQDLYNIYVSSRTTEQPI